jgi:hypothetical protein
MNTVIDLGTTARLQGRARRLRSQAESLHPLLGEAYRRRAAELDVQAWLEAAWNPAVDTGEALPTPEPATAPTTASQLHLAVA